MEQDITPPQEAKMFEALSTRHQVIAALPASKHPTAKAITPDNAKVAARAERLVCPDQGCGGSLTFTNATPTRVAYFSHRVGSMSADCQAEGVGGGEGPEHQFLKADLFGAAVAHELVLPGCRPDVVVDRKGGKKLTAIEIQISPIEPETVLRRHAAHQAAGLVGTLWLVNAEHLGPADVAGTSWLADLLLACLDTPSGYGCVVGFLGVDGIRFVGRIVAQEGLHRTVRVTDWSRAVPLEAVRWWAAGNARPSVVPEALAEGIRTLDAAPTRRVKGWRAPSSTYRTA